jgi:Histidine kinase/Histidine kinase-, DNA gyrase B-, and HSP90-like ATPase/Two component regulator propeller
MRVIAQSVGHCTTNADHCKIDLTCVFWFNIESSVIVRSNLVFCLVTLLQVALHAQRVHTPVIVSDLLPTPAVTSITKDADGFMWIGTRNGLSRYDGTSVRNFYHIPDDPGSLAHNTIFEMLYDEERKVLWIGTLNGLSRLDLETYQFYNPTLEAYVQSGEDPLVETMCFDHAHRLWFSIEGVGLATYDMASDTVICYPMDFEVTPPMQLRNLKGILGIAPDPVDTDIMWVSSGGLVRFDISEHRYVPYYFLDPNPEAQGYYNQLRIVKPLIDSSIWLGTWSRGMLRYTPDRSVTSPKLVAPDEFAKYKIPSPVPPLLQIDKDHVYLNSAKSCVMNLHTGDLSDCISMKNQLNKRYGVQLQYIDEDARKWGTSEYGMHIFDPLSEQITNYMFPAKEPFFYIRGKFIEIGPDQILITYQSCEGAYVFYKSTGLVRTLHPITERYITDHGFKGHEFIRRPNGEIWILERHKMYRVQLSSNKLIPLDLPIDRLRYLWISAIQDRDGVLWLGTSHSGLVRYDPEARSILTFRDELEANGDGRSDWLDYLHVDINQDIWIRKGSGYSVYLRKKNAFLNFNTLDNKEFQLTNFVEDDEGNIWSAASGLGLLKMHRDVPERGVMEVIGVKEGLKDDKIASISMDMLGHIWMITQSGLQKFDPVTHKSRMFGVQDGMITYDARFNRNPAVLSHLGILPDGRMAYAPRAGFSIFDPTGMKTNTEIPTPFFVRITASDSVIASDLFPPIEDITFPFKANNIEIECSAIGYSQSASMTYEYRLSDTLWQRMENRNVQFLNLAPDDYKFELRVLNSAGIPSARLEWHFKVMKPWWGAWWFYTACFLVLLALIWQIMRYRDKNRERIRSKEHEIKVLMASLESRALRNQMNPHFLFNIFNNIQELILTGDTEKAYAYTTKFSKLLRTILNNARKDEITIDQEQDFLILYLELESLRFDDAFDYRISVEEGLELVYIPVFVIQPLVENAIRHGLLPKRGKKELEISFSSDNEGITCSVRDNGIGMGNDSDGALADGRAHAIELIRKRLKLLNNGVLNFESTDEKGVLVEIKIPFQNHV